MTQSASGSVLELRISQATVIQCMARAGALDAFQLPSPSGSYRVAPDELLVVGSGTGRTDLIDAASRTLGRDDPGSLVVDMSDGWSIVSVHGPACDAVLARLSAVKPAATRPAFLQAAIADVPARAIVLDDSVHILVESTVTHHVRARILAACADLGVQEMDAPPLEPLTR